MPTSFGRFLVRLSGWTRCSKGVLREKCLRGRAPWGVVVAVALATAGLVGVYSVTSAPAAHARRGRDIARTYHLPGGGTLLVPSTSLTRGAHVVVRRAPRRASGRFLHSVGVPVALYVAHGHLIGPVALTFPYRAKIDPLGMPPDETVQIAFYDPREHAWVSVPAHVDSRHHTVSATITHFSWWNPFTWDWSSLFLSLDQAVGQLRGARTGPAKCTSGLSVPAWATAETNNGVDLPIRTCAEGQGSNVVVQIVNNRPYSVILKYGAPVAFGWHQVPGDAAQAVASEFADQLVSRNELYIPPLSSASIGVPQGSWYFALFQAEITPKSLGADAMSFIAQELDARAIRPELLGQLASHCSAILKPAVDGAPEITTSATEWLSAIGDCFHRAVPALAASGALDKANLQILDHVSMAFAMLKTASTTAQLVGELGDFYNGLQPDLQANATFNIRRNGASTPAPPTTAPPQTTQPPPTNTPPGSTVAIPPPPPPPSTYSEQETFHHPVNTFQNYHNASGPGQSIAAGQVVEVSCKVQDGTIPSVNPDGYWYRIASSPWNNSYYAAANTFLNGDPPNGPYSHNTDFAVPDC